MPRRVTPSANQRWLTLADPNHEDNSAAGERLCRGGFQTRPSPRGAAGRSRLLAASVLSWPRLRHAASCRSTYSRMPPWRWYDSSAGVSMRQVTRKVVTFPSALVAVTLSSLRTLRPPATPLMS